MFCSVAKIIKIFGAVEDLYLIAEIIETFKKNSRSDENDISTRCKDCIT